MELFMYKEKMATEISEVQC